jgi:hypothetical protein
MIYVYTYTYKTLNLWYIKKCVYLLDLASRCSSYRVPAHLLCVCVCERERASERARERDSEKERE